MVVLTVLATMEVQLLAVMVVAAAVLVVAVAVILYSAFASKDTFVNIHYYYKYNVVLELLVFEQHSEQLLDKIFKQIFTRGYLRKMKKLIKTDAR